MGLGAPIELVITFAVLLSVAIGLEFCVLCNYDKDGDYHSVRR
jgi:hypothetical protein